MNLKLVFYYFIKMVPNNMPSIKIDTFQEIKHYHKKASAGILIKRYPRTVYNTPSVFYTSNLEFNLLSYIFFL